jgi:hypothetical protein
MIAEIAFPVNIATPQISRGPGFATFASFAPLRETCWSESQIPL